MMLSWRAHCTDDLWLNPHQPHAQRCAVKPEIIKLMQYHNMQMTPWFNTRQRQSVMVRKPYGLWNIADGHSAFYSSSNLEEISLALMAVRVMTHIIIFIMAVFFIVCIIIIIFTCPIDSLGGGDGIQWYVQPLCVVNFFPYKDIIITSPESRN